MKKITITIGISAFNEEKKIVSTINAILLQKFNANTVLEKIIIYSDGSLDKTVELAKGVKNRKILVVDDKTNKGKPQRINDIFEIANSDVCVILDADIELSGEDCIQNLVEPFVKDEEIKLTYGRIDPHTPVNFLQRALKAGIYIWEEAERMANSEMYYCGGPIRAFSKKLYKEMKFPSYSADDVFPYLYCLERNYKTNYVTNALAYYMLPLNFTDYIKQLSRFVMSPEIQTINFGEEVIKENYTIDTGIKIRAFLKFFNEDPFMSTSYIAIWSFAQLIILFKKKNIKGNWDLALSTK